MAVVTTPPFPSVRVRTFPGLFTNKGETCPSLTVRGAMPVPTWMARASSPALRGIRERMYAHAGAPTVLAVMVSSRFAVARDFWIPIRWHWTARHRKL